MIRQLKALLLAGLFIGSFGLAGNTAAAQFDLVPACKDNPNASICPEAKSTKNPLYGPDGIITKVANILAIVVGVAAVIVIIVAGIQYMLSTGDPTKVNNAKNAILYALVGVGIVVVARTIIVFFIGKLQ